MAENYCDIMGDLVQSYKAMGRTVFLRVYFLDFHLDSFPENLGL
jgi:hypothetical protein